VTEFPDPAELYPEVAALGSLAAALRASAADLGLSLGEVTADEKQPLRYALVGDSGPLRDSLGVSAGHTERIWSIGAWGQGIEMVRGRTRELSEVAKAAHAWLAGAALRDIQRAAPFVELGPLAEAAEQGPAQVVTAQWETLRRDADEAGRPEHRALIEAAHAEPKLRQLYPFTSHWSLRFSTTTGIPFSPDLVCLDAARSAHFVVKTGWQGSELGVTGTAEEAVALAVGHLPENLGPAVAGPYSG
jgi:hypothetical protein